MEERCVALSHAAWQLHHNPEAHRDKAEGYHTRNDAQYDHLRVLVAVLVISGPADDLWVTLHSLVSIRMCIALQRREDGRKNCYERSHEGGTHHTNE